MSLYRVLIAIALCVISASLIVGCGGGGGGGGVPAGFSSVRAITPAGWSFEGGTVTIEGTLADGTDVTGVRAEVTKPGGAKDPIPVAMTSTGGGTYSGTYAVGPNTGSQAATYTVVATVTRGSGAQGSSAPFTIEVPAASLPPGPP